MATPNRSGSAAPAHRPPEGTQTSDAVQATVIVLPTAAALPVVNSTRMGRRARGGKVTLACDLADRRNRKALGDKREQRPAGLCAKAERLRGALGYLVDHGSLGLSEEAMWQLYASTRRLMQELRAKEHGHE